MTATAPTLTPVVSLALAAVPRTRSGRDGAVLTTLPVAGALETWMTSLLETCRVGGAVLAAYAEVGRLVTSDNRARLLHSDPLAVRRWDATIAAWTAAHPAEPQPSTARWEAAVRFASALIESRLGDDEIEDEALLAA